MSSRKRSNGSGPLVRRMTMGSNPIELADYPVMLMRREQCQASTLTSRYGIWGLLRRSMFFLANKAIILALAQICYEAVNAADDFLP